MDKKIGAKMDILIHGIPSIEKENRELFMKLQTFFHVCYCIAALFIP